MQSIRAIDPARYPRGERADITVPLYEDALGHDVVLPFVLIHGARPGPVVGVSAAVHGDELNGIRIIHELATRLDPKTMRGSVLCAPVVNVPAFLAGQRRFTDGNDLNHSFPGKKGGRPAEQYAAAFVKTFLPPCDVIVDIHTASQGRVNSYYVRADLLDTGVREIAMLMNADIVLHVRGGDGTLRNAARLRRTPSITVEAGNPLAFQGKMVNRGAEGVLNLLRHMRIIDGEIHVPQPPVICSSSQWLRTESGGILDLKVDLTERIDRNAVVAISRDPFGHERSTYRAPHAGIVIGMARNPVAVPGTRYCHLGRIGEPKATTRTTGVADP